MNDWRPIPSSGGRYWASADGQIRGPSGRIRRQHRSSNGYWRITINAGGRPRSCFVHHLVAEAFLGPRPDGLVVCHGPAGKDCNAASNLRYASQSENCSVDKQRDGTAQRGSRHGRSTLTAAHVLAIRAMACGPYRQEDIAWAIGTSRANVANIASGRSWSWLTAA